MSQQIELQPGWNAVFLRVQPDPPDCNGVFTNTALSIERVHSYRRVFSTVQFLQDTNIPVAGGADWLTWVPPGTEAIPANALFTLTAGKAYFIKRPSASAPVIWELTGKPVLKTPDWKAGAFNLVGFETGTNPPPTFAEFFAGSGQLAGEPIYRMSAAGIWQPVANPVTTRIRPGEAFWIRMEEFTAFQGPIAVDTGQRAGLDFGRMLIERELLVRNDAALSKNILVRPVPSAPVPVRSSTPLLAGEVPLSCMTFDASNHLQRVTLTGAGIQKTLARGEVWRLRLSVRRPDMAPFTPPPDGEALYQSLLEVTDGGALRRTIPVVAQGLGLPGAAGAALSAMSSTAPILTARAGLWVGTVSLNKVNQPSSSEPDRPTPTASDFSFRVIIHVDTNGAVRLLQNVVLMWKEGSYREVPDPADPNKTVNEVDQPGRYVLVTDRTLYGSFSGSTLRDGHPVGRRISTAAFPLAQPLAMTRAGGFGESAGTLAATVTLAYNDPLNPFVHRFHPDHDNQDDLGGALPAEEESYTITRRIEAEFTGADPEGLNTTGWGDNQVGGIWRESISGLRHQTNHVEGFFRLRQASRIGVLNDGR